MVLMAIICLVAVGIAAVINVRLQRKLNHANLYLDQFLQKSRDDMEVVSPEVIAGIQRRAIFYLSQQIQKDLGVSPVITPDIVETWLAHRGAAS